MSKMSLATFLRRFEAGEFSFPDLATQFEAGWYDWFCRDSSLVTKTKNLGKKVKQISTSAKIDLENNYVFFKNNCPMCGPLYDDFRICSMETGNVIYTVTPKSGRTGKAEVWGKENDFSVPLVSGTWHDVKKFFDI